MTGNLKRLPRMLVRGWHLLRQASGDDAYERYLAHCRSHHPEREPMSRRDFYRARLESAWRGVNRCC